MAASRKRFALALLAALALLQGCGGGGGSAAPAAVTPAAVTPAANVIATAGPNVQPISVDAGPFDTVNQVFTSVTICAPGSSSACATIDHVLVDTGSTGLRIMHSAQVASLSLPQQSAPDGNPLAECAHFVDGNSWGPVKLADLEISGEQASGLAIQVIGDPGFPVVPAACASTGPIKDTPQSFGANGILGVGIFRQDCGDACVRSAAPGIYFACPPAGCVAAATPLTSQVQHPVTLFATDNNGVILELPSVPAAGAVRVSGSLVFGIGTRANNALGAATVIGVDPATANFTTVYKGIAYTASFVDSGSNGLFFVDTSMARCTNPTTAEFYCPPSTSNLSATMQGRNGTSARIDFSVANAAALVAGNPDFAAFANLAAPLLSADSFDWGLPFFFGRRVYTAIEGPSAPAGPYIAF